MSHTTVDLDTVHDRTCNKKKLIQRMLFMHNQKLGPGQDCGWKGCSNSPNVIFQENYVAHGLQTEVKTILLCDSCLTSHIITSACAELINIGDGEDIFIVDDDISRNDPECDTYCCYRLRTITLLSIEKLSL